MAMLSNSSEVSTRYKEKVRDFCDGIDPYNLNSNNKDPLPRNVHYFDIVHYCLDKDSTYTFQAFKAFKTLESYRIYESGWVQSVVCKSIQTGSIILAEVNVCLMYERQCLKGNASLTCR